MTEYALKLNQEEDYVVRENYALGLLGAIGGGVLGALLIFLIARIGFVSSYAGLAMLSQKKIIQNMLQHYPIRRVNDAFRNHTFSGRNNLRCLISRLID